MEATPTQQLDVCRFIEELYRKMAEFEKSLDTVEETEEENEEASGRLVNTSLPTIIHVIDTSYYI